MKKDAKPGNSGTLADAASLIALANESDAAAAATELNYDDLWLYSLAVQKWYIYGTACDALGLLRSDQGVTATGFLVTGGAQFLEATLALVIDEHWVLFTNLHASRAKKAVTFC